jgi:hypothetical protein
MKELLTEFLADLLGEADSAAAKQAKAAKLKSIPNSRGLWSPTGKKPATASTKDGKFTLITPEKTPTAKKTVSKSKPTKPATKPAATQVQQPKVAIAKPRSTVPDETPAPSQPPVKGAGRIPKSKELDQNIDTVQRFNEDPIFSADGVSDADFNNNPRVMQTDAIITQKTLEKFFVGENGNTAFPKKYLKVLARLLSTKGGEGLTISDFTNASGAGTLSSTTGELLTMMALTIEDNDKASEFFNLIQAHVKTLQKTKQGIIDVGWVKSAKGVRSIMRRRYDKKFGAGNWQLDSMAWDVKDEVESLGLSDYKQNKGYSTDTYAKIKVKGTDGNWKSELDEISLKKELSANLLNATSGRLADIMVYGEATPEDIEIYENLNSRLSALGPVTSSAAKKEKKEISAQLEEIRKKYNVNVPDMVRVEYAQAEQERFYEEFLADPDTLVDVNKFLKQWCGSKDQAWKSQVASAVSDHMNQTSAYNAKLSQNISTVCKQSSGGNFASSEEFDTTINQLFGNTKDRQKFLLSLMYGVTDNVKSKTNKSKEYIDKLVANSHAHSKAVRDFLLVNPAARKGLLLSIRDAFPLRALFEGEESMALGETMADSDILKHIFQSDTFAGIEQNLNVRDEPPPPSIIYRAANSNIDIPIAAIVSRPDGIAYGASWKLIMEVHPDFAKLLKEANTAVYGAEK